MKISKIIHFISEMVSLRLVVEVPWLWRSPGCGGSVVVEVPDCGGPWLWRSLVVEVPWLWRSPGCGGPLVVEVPWLWRSLIVEVPDCGGP